MRLFTILVVLFATTLAVPAAANDADKQAKEAKKDRVVCRTTMITGSRFEQRTCKTAAQWEEQAEKHKDRWREELSKPVVPPDLRS